MTRSLEALVPSILILALFVALAVTAFRATDGARRSDEDDDEDDDS